MSVKRTYKDELKSIDRRISFNSSKIHSGQARYDQVNGSPSSFSQTKAKNIQNQTNLNNTETTAYLEGNSSRIQPNQANEDITWRELSFNIPSQLIKVHDFVSHSSHKKMANNNGYSTGLKSRPMSSQLSSPILQALSNREKSNSQHLSITQGSKIHNTSKLSLTRKSTNAIKTPIRVKTDEDRKIKQKGIQQMQDAALFDFLQDHLEDLYSDQALDPYKANMNLEKRTYALTEVHQQSESSIQALEQKMKLKTISEQQRNEVEYQLEKKKAYEENKLYFKKLYKIQKSALNNYLKGDGVEDNVISCHKEIVNPLASYVKQKQRENLLQHQQELNRSFIRNSKKPVFESQLKKKQEFIETQMYKSNSRNSEQKQSGNSIQELQKQKEQFQQEAQANFLETFLKGERTYFEKLGNISRIAAHNFVTDIHVNQKYYYDQQVQPKQQFITEEDMKIEKNVNLIKSISMKHAQQQQNSGQRNSFLLNKNTSSIIIAKGSRDIAALRKVPSKMSPDLKPSLQQSPILDEHMQHSRIQAKKLTFLDQDYFNSDTESKIFTQNLYLNAEMKDNHSSNIYKKNKLLTNLLDRYSQHQDDFIKNQKETISQKEKTGESIDKMNLSKAKLSQNIASIKQVPLLTDFEKEIFQQVKANKIKELEVCLQVNQSIVNLQDHTGKTLLHWAAMRGLEDIVQMLLTYKADLSIVDFGNKMPKDLALMHNKQNVYGILQKEERYLKYIEIPKNNANNFNNIPEVNSPSQLTFIEL